MSRHASWPQAGVLSVQEDREQTAPDKTRHFSPSWRGSSGKDVLEWVKEVLERVKQCTHTIAGEAGTVVGE